MATSSRILLMGFYDPVERRNMVEKRLEAEIKRIQETNFIDGSPQASNDAASTEMKAKENKRKPELHEFFPAIKSLIMKSEKFLENNQARHLTKTYRTLQGACSKLQQQIDNVEAKIDMDSEKKRKKKGQALSLIDKISALLRSNVHENEQTCEGCELHQTKWAKQQLSASTEIKRKDDDDESL